MERRDDLRLRRLIGPFRRSHLRFALFAGVGVLSAGTVAGLAFAGTGSAPIGTGVVVVDSNLSYQGGHGAGTGMVLSGSGEVLTNNHVIKGATSIKIVVPETGHSYKATVVGYDVFDDVAVLQADGAPNLTTVSLGNSATVRRGQSVRAVGNAGGTGRLSSVSGKVTALARAITVSDGQGGAEHLTGLIESNAALQPGDSGGPLENAAGKVVGMDTAASTGFRFQNVSSKGGYSIPINKAVTIARRIENGEASATVHIGGTAFLGVEVEANPFGASGAMVVDVVQGSPARRAGLVPGDLVTRFAGRSIGPPTELTALVLAEKPGARVKLSYVDQAGVTRSATTTLASGPAQ